MGCFDTVHVRCPHCDTLVEIQSKAGKCHLLTYSQDSVPMSIADDLIEDSERRPEYCTSCSQPFKIITKQSKRVKLKSVKIDDDEYEYD
jgi:hypothetical protein